MTEKQILFSAPMVRALLSGMKTQTRRPVKTEIVMGNESHVGRRKNGYAMCYQMHIEHDLVNLRGANPYGLPGDRLVVREAFRATGEVDFMPPRKIQPGARIWYEADAPRQPGFGKLRPSMFMPRWASRITLEITSVRVERLQDISEADALAEGVITWADGACAKGNPKGLTPVDYYELMWSQINGRESWDANPFVWCISFKRIEA